MVRHSQGADDRDTAQNFLIPKGGPRTRSSGRTRPLVSNPRPATKTKTVLWNRACKYPSRRMPLDFRCLGSAGLDDNGISNVRRSARTPRERPLRGGGAMQESVVPRQ